MYEDETSCLFHSLLSIDYASRWTQFCRVGTAHEPTPSRAIDSAHLDSIEIDDRCGKFDSISCKVRSRVASIVAWCVEVAGVARWHGLPIRKS
jgi:hypothetical protein